VYSEASQAKRLTPSAATLSSCQYAARNRKRNSLQNLCRLRGPAKGKRRSQICRKFPLCSWRVYGEIQKRTLRLLELRRGDGCGRGSRTSPFVPAGSPVVHTVECSVTQVSLPSRPRVTQGQAACLAICARRPGADPPHGPHWFAAAVLPHPCSTANSTFRGRPGAAGAR
jgi:hypothetical protein